MNASRFRNERGAPPLMDEIFKGRLKELRKAASLTQAQFSEQLNVHLQTVSKWERGVSHN